MTKQSEPSPDDHVEVHVRTLDGRDVIYEVRRGEVKSITVEPERTESD